MSEPTTQKPNYQFRIIHVMYCMAMLGVALAVLGTWGLLVGIAICSFWARSWYLGRLPITVLQQLGTVGGICLFCCLPFGVVSISPTLSTPHSIRCQLQLGIIDSAIQNYKSVNGEYPPAIVYDENGKPMHSWRVLILRYLEPELFAEYDMNEPWNGPNNIKLLDFAPRSYQCSGSYDYNYQTNCTCYVAITGDKTAWPTRKPVNMPLDGEVDNVYLVEVYDSKIPWTKPVDYSYQQAIEKLSSTSSNTVQLNHKHGRNVLSTLGRWQPILAEEHSREFWEIFIDPTRDFDPQHPPATLPDYSLYINSFRIALFIVCIFLPGPFLLRKQVHNE